MNAAPLAPGSVIILPGKGTYCLKSAACQDLVVIVAGYSFLGPLLERVLSCPAGISVRTTSGQRADDASSHLKLEMAHGIMLERLLFEDEAAAGFPRAVGK